jgi:hypothetical protein
MRKSFWVISALLLFAASAEPTFADSTEYKITFIILSTGSPGENTAPPTGSFTYDPSIGFSNFLVMWDGLTFNLTAAANDPLINEVSGCNGEAAGGPAYGFSIMTQTLTGCSISTVDYNWAVGVGVFACNPCNAAINIGVGSTFDTYDDFMHDTLFSVPYPGPGSDGETPGANGTGWDISPVSTATVPEPSTIALMLLAVGFMFVMRKRMGHPARPQAT